MVSPMTTVNPNLWPNSFHFEGKSYSSKTIPSIKYPQVIWYQEIQNVNQKIQDTKADAS